jgi:hypothetical protein
MIEIEIILVLIFVGVCFTVYRLTKLLEIGNKILQEVTLARPKNPPRAEITEEPLPPPLRLTREDIKEATSYKP